jgi:hypothetical protein
MDRLAQRVLTRFMTRVAFEKGLVSFGIKDLEQLSKMGRQFAVISAYRPPDEHGKHENKQRHGDLMADLQRMGYRKFETLRSSWEDMASGTRHGERSILVPGMSFKDATHLMKKYNQDGILYKDPSGSVGIYKKDGKAEMAYDPKTGDPAISKALDKSEYSKGRSMSFGLQLVEGEIPWSDGPVTGEQIKKHVEATAAKAEKKTPKESPKEEAPESSKWWESQTPAFKRKYIEEHPQSVYAP